MNQLLCHVNVPVPADTCLTRTADRAILDFVPDMKRTVIITTKFYDNFKDFGTIPVHLQFPTGNPKRQPFLTQVCWANWAGCATTDALCCESLYFTRVPYIILQNCVF